MASRAFQIVVVVFWLASMVWLTTTKLVPLLITGERPDYHAGLPATAEKPELIGWELQLNQRPIGWAVNRSRRLADGSGELNSVVHFDHLPLAKILEQSLPLLKSLLPAGDQFEITSGWELTIRSRVDLQPNHRMQRMQTIIDLGPLQNVIRLDGRVDGSTLHVQVATTAGLEAGPDQREIKIFEKDFDFPGDDVVADSLAPQPRLDRLRVGAVLGREIGGQVQLGTLLQQLGRDADGRGASAGEGGENAVVVAEAGAAAGKHRRLCEEGFGGEGPGDVVRGRPADLDSAGEYRRDGISADGGGDGSLYGGPFAGCVWNVS